MTARSQATARGRRVDLTEGPLLSRLVTLAWPLFVGNILTTVYNLVDMYWVSWVSTDAVAAVAITFPTVWLTFSLGMGVTIAGVAFVAQHFGAGESEKASHVAGQVVTMATAVAIVLGAVGAYFRVPIVQMMGAQGPVLEQAADYLLIEMIGLPLRYIFFAYRSVSQGAGDSKTPRNLLVFSVVLNMILDPFMVLGWAGLPAMGVVGAAWATFIAQGVGAVLSLVYLARGSVEGLRVRARHLRPDWSQLRRVAEVGFPASLDMGARGLSSVVVAAIVSRFGPVEAAAYGIVNRLMSITWTSSGAMEQATASGVGQNLGAGQKDRAEKAAWTGSGVMFLFLTVVGVLMYIFAEPLVQLFRVDDDVVATAVRFLRLHVLSYGFLGVRDVLQGAFRGAGRTFPPAAITFVNLWIFQIPLTLWVSNPLGYGSDGYWWVVFFTNILFAGVAAIWFCLARWHRAIPTR